MKKIIFKNFKYLILILFIFLMCACSINFYDDYEYYDYNKYILEETKRKEEERERKINGRNYVNTRLNPYFVLLNDQEKQVYYDILELATSYSMEITDLTYNVNSIELSNIFKSVLYDNPELFWLKSYIYYHDENMDKVYSIQLVYYDDIENISLMREEFERVVNDYVLNANKYNTDYEKEKIVHDMLVNNFEYDSNMHEDQRSYGALIYNKAVCTGYAKAFQVIMRRLNIPTFFVVGDATNEKNETGMHAWNLILLDGEYYNVDVTWDDPINLNSKNKTIHKYLNVSDEFLNKNHTRTNLSINLPNALNHQYENINY